MKTFEKFSVLAALCAGSLLAHADPGVWCEPVDGNTIWTPGGKRIFHTHADSPSSLNLVPKGDDAQKKDPIVRIEFDLPAGARVADAFVLVPRMRLNHLQRFSAPLNVGAKPAGELTRYSLADFPAEAGGVAGDSVILTFGQLDASKADAPVLWRTVRKSGAVTEGEPFTVKFLPPMPESAKPKRMGHTALFYTFDMQVPEDAAFDAILKKYEAANIGGRWAVRGDPKEKFSPAWFDRKLAARGWAVYPEIGAESAIDWQPGVTFPLPPGAKKAGRLDKQPMLINGFTPLCPTYAAKDPAYVAAYRAWIKGYADDAAAVYDGKPVKEMMIDIEPFKTPDQACFCDDCVRDFAKSAGLDEAALLGNKQSLLTGHKDAWALYQSRIESEAIARAGEIFHEFSPETKLSYYCHLVDWANTDLAKFFSGAGSRLDARVMDRVTDIHAPSFYNIENAKAVTLFEAFQQGLKKDQYPFLSISRAIGPESWYTTRDGTVSPDGYFAKMMGLAAAGAKGFYIFPGRSIDGLYFDAMRRAQANFALTEDFYLDGKKAGVTGSAAHLRNASDYIVVRSQELHGETLVTVVNYHPTETAYVKLDWPGAPQAFGIADLSARNLLADSAEAWNGDSLQKDFLLKVPPNGARLLVLNPSAKRVEGWETVAVEPVRKEYQETAGNEAAALEKMRGETKSITSAIERGGLAPESVSASLHQLQIGVEEGLLVMQSPLQKVWIAPADGGKITKWQIKSDGMQILPNENYGKGRPGDENAAWDCFWMPATWRYYYDKNDWEYRVMEALINEQGVASVKLALLNKNRNMVLEKTFRMKAESTSIEVDVAIRNIGEDPLAFNFWVRNNPKLGFDPATTRVLMPVNGKMVDARTANPATAGWNCVALTDAATASKQLELFRPGVMKESDVLGKATEGKIVVQSADGKATLTAEMDLDQVLALSRTPAGGETWSIDWIYREADLQPLDTWQTRYRLTIAQH